LLDLDLLRRDEIWFVEKAPSGASAHYIRWKNSSHAMIWIFVKGIYTAVSEPFPYLAAISIWKKLMQRRYLPDVAQTPPICS
jgi:hypothetical protein